MSVSMVLGVGVVAGLLILFSYILGEKHKILRHFLLMVVLPLLFLIPASLTMEQEVCQPVVANETVSGNYTSYEYQNYCYDDSNGSEAFIYAYGTILVLFMIYAGIMFFGDVLKWFRNIVKKI